MQLVVCRHWLRGVGNQKTCYNPQNLLVLKGGVVDVAGAVGYSLVEVEGRITSESMFEFSAATVLGTLILLSVFMTRCSLTFRCMMSVKCFRYYEWVLNVFMTNIWLVSVWCRVGLTVDVEVLTRWILY